MFLIESAEVNINFVENKFGFYLLVFCVGEFGLFLIMKR